MKIKALVLMFALALTMWAQTDNKTTTPAATDKKSCCASGDKACCGEGKSCCGDAKEAKGMKCDMKDGKGCCGGDMKGCCSHDMANMKGMDHSKHMAEMKGAKGEHKMSCCSGEKGMKCAMSAKADAKDGDKKEAAKGCCGDKCPMHGDHAAHSGN